MTNCGDTVADWNGGIVDWIDVAVYWRGFYNWNVFKWTCSKSEQFDNWMVHFVCEAVRWLFTNVQLAKFSRNWNWMEYRLVACVCSWCCSVGWWWCECYKLNLNVAVDSNKWSSFHVRAKRTLNVVISDLQMAWKVIITFGPTITVWTVIIENVIQVGSSEEVWCMCDIYIYIYIWYMIYLTVIGFIRGGSSTVHINTQTIHRTTKFTI